MRKIFTLFIAALCCAGLANATEGALPGAFTINKYGDKIQFSQGNLRYNIGTGEWRFAENQYDAIGMINNNVFHDYYTGEIDLFGYGTGNNPTNISGTTADYKEFVDWGTNAISNGENIPYIYRTMTSNEWTFLFFSRPDANNLFALGKVNDIQGLILLPDNWVLPAGLTFNSSVTQGMTYNGTCFIASSEMDLNIYTLEQWEQMETAGAVFLPVTGFRDPNLGVVASNQGVYWQGQQNTTITTVFCVNFSFFSSSNAIYPSNVSEVYSIGMAVRLVTPYEDPTPVIKDLTGIFSVSATKYVTFAQGNLQYNATTDIWKFAAKQYDMAGAKNANISASYSGWIDLFGWGTGNNPVETSTESAPYASYSDWTANPIVNGNNETWYTLSAEEWNYLLNTRPNAANLKGQAVVNDIKGYILLPDNWTTPLILTFTPTPNDYTTNVYTLGDWELMEAAGAVFLPAAGDRYGTSINSIKAGNGSYWKPTPSSEYSDMAQAVTFTAYTPARVSDAMVQMGYAVRPARDVKANEGIDQPTSDSSLKGRANKVLRNGILYIERNGKTYNAMGTEVR